MRKTNKMRLLSKYLLPIILVTIIYLTISIISEPKEYRDSKYKFELMKETIRSNNASGLCQIPVLPINSPEMMSFIYDEPSLDCGNQKDWVICKGSICSINPLAITEYGPITCDFMDIIRIDDKTYKYGKKYRSTDHYLLQKSDIAKVDCWTNAYFVNWSGILIGVRDKLGRSLTKPTRSSHALNVLMFGLDSLSKNAFIRKLPKTYQYLTEQLNGDILQGYNIIGDGTPQALIPILTGFTELELPDTRRRISGSQLVNVYPMIWKDYERMGYVTSFNEDIPNYGTFTYRLNGFKEQPTDHYMRTYYEAIEPELERHKKLCVGNRPRHQVMLDYTYEILQNYDNPNFIFSFHGELSHDSINLVGVADDDITEWLKKMHSNSLLNNTILILMSDHGNRFATVRNTLQGKLEERLPFFSFVFPAWFKQKYFAQYNNFKANLHRLTTPFDIHATLTNILKLDEPKITTPKQQSMPRGISLFEAIPLNRTCPDAFIEPHWCACLNWQSIANLQNTNIVNAAMAIVTKINNITSKNRRECALLHLHQIKWAAKLAPHDYLLRYSKNKDIDGFLADLSSNTKVSNELYQIKMTVKPGKSIFEASVMHDLIQNEFKVNTTDISRINKYGNQAACIMDRNPEIRKYCFCKKDAFFK